MVSPPERRPKFLKDLAIAGAAERPTFLRESGHNLNHAFPSATNGNQSLGSNNFCNFPNNLQFLEQQRPNILGTNNEDRPGKRSGLSLKERMRAYEQQVSKSSSFVASLVVMPGTVSDMLSTIPACRSTRHLAKYGCQHLIRPTPARRQILC